MRSQWCRVRPHGAMFGSFPIHTSTFFTTPLIDNPQCWHVMRCSHLSQVTQHWEEALQICPLAIPSRQGRDEVFIERSRGLKDATRTNSPAYRPRPPGTASYTDIDAPRWRSSVEDGRFTVLVHVFRY